MSESEQDKNKDKEVEIFHRVNKLKLKAGAESMHDGPGFIDLSSVKRAQNVLETKLEVYPKEIEDVLNNLEKAWKKAIKDKKHAKKAFEQIYHYANHANDLAATFGFELMQHFGTSLRDFAEKIDVDNPAHHTIVRAHLDVMKVVYEENIKDYGGPKAEELKKMVVKAIEKHSGTKE